MNLNPKMNIIEFIEPAHIKFQAKLLAESSLYDKYPLDIGIFTDGVLILTDYYFMGQPKLTPEDFIVRYIYFKVDYTLSEKQRIFLFPHADVNSTITEGRSIEIDIHNLHNYSYRYDKTDLPIGGADFDSINVISLFMSYISKLNHILNSKFNVQEHYCKDDKYILTITKNRVTYRLILNKTIYTIFANKYLQP